MKTPLCELAEKWGTDKTPSILHNYTPFYHQLLSGMWVRRVLEIGILNGASLRMWREYFRGAQIFGLEINPAALFNEERIETRQCDASDTVALRVVAESLGGGFDFIVDDASHDRDHQLITFHALWPYLAPGGTYVIEDVAHPGHVSLGIDEPHLVLRTAPTPHDDCLIVIPGRPRQ